MTPATSNALRLTAPASEGRPWTRIFRPAYEGGVLCSVRQKIWTGVSAVVKELKCSGPFRADLQSECSRLLITLDEVGDHTEARSSPSRSTPNRHDTVHLMAYSPAGCPIWAHSERTRYRRGVDFSFDHATVTALMDEDVDLTSLLEPRFSFFDERLLHLTRLFVLECEGASSDDLLYGDSLSLALLLRLSQLGRSQGRAPVRGGLSSTQLRRATEYLSCNLENEVSLKDLANLTQLSRSYFCRAFRVSTGMPPHQWRLQAKVHKAQELLLDGTLALGDIALATGFSDQAHLTRAFKRFVGASPAAWRRQKNG